MFASQVLREQRYDKLARLATDGNLDAVILTDLKNVRYATDIKPLHSIFFVKNYIAVVVPGEKAALLASEADEQFVRQKMPWVRWFGLPSFVPSGTPREEQSRLIAEAVGKDAARIGYDTLSLDQFQSLSAQLKADFVSISDRIQRVRAIKSEEEVDVILRACQFADIGMRAVRENAIPGTPEFVLVAEAIYAMKKAGAEAESHLPAIRSGENAAMLQRVDSDTPVRPGDSIVADLGARYLGYSAEYCRTIMVGRPSEKLGRMYKALRQAYSAGLEAMKPGVSVHEIDRIIRRVIAAAGYPDYPHATGHGIGMANAEYPTVNRNNTSLLKENMIVCIEPGICVPGVGAVKEEDLVFISSEGPVVLTDTPYDPVLSEYCR